MNPNKSKYIFLLFFTNLLLYVKLRFIIVLRTKGVALNPSGGFPPETPIRGHPLTPLSEERGNPSDWTVPVQLSGQSIWVIFV